MAANIKVRPNRNFQRQIMKIVGNNLEEFARFVVLRSRRGVVKVTGNLSRNIRVYNDGQEIPTPGTEPDRKGALDKGLIVQTTSGYGAYIELGTAKMAAQPFLAPAVQDESNAWKRGGELFPGAGR